MGDTLDVRPAREFQAGHFASAASVPLDVLETSLQLLPSRARPLWVFGDDQDMPRALEILREHEYTAAEPHPAMAPGAAPSRAVDSPWVGGEARVRLWEPNPFLAEVLADPERPAGGTAVDAACGSGRDATYLALAGFHTTGVDLLPDALEKARVLAESAQRAVPELELPQWVRANLEKRWPFGDTAFDLVTCSRFLWRELFPALASAVRPGGSLVYTAFTVHQRRHGKPAHPDHLARENELAERFQELGLTIVRYREDDPERGPALAHLWATRPRH